MPVFAELGSASLRVSNAKARRELGRMPRFATIDEGLGELRAVGVPAARAGAHEPEALSHG
jgi:hypothetical protein